MVETEIDAPEKAKSWKNRDDSAKSGGAFVNMAGFHDGAGNDLGASDEAEVQGQESIPEWFQHYLQEQEGHHLALSKKLEVQRREIQLLTANLKNNQPPPVDTSCPHTEEPTYHLNKMHNLEQLETGEKTTVNLSENRDAGCPRHTIGKFAQFQN